MEANDSVRVGVAGLGRSGWTIHAMTLEALPQHYTVAAGCDADPARQDEFTKRFGTPCYSKFEELIADSNIELVVVAVPSYLHADYTVRALEAGKHVLVEKPMARSVEEVDRMVEAARASGRILTVFHNYRYSFDAVKVREVIESGKLGRIVMIRIARHGFYRRWDWQTLKEFGGGQLNIAGSHLVDLALQLIPGVEPQVTCALECTDLWAGDADSHVKIILQAPQQPLIDIEITNVCAYPQETWLVMGTRGTATGGSHRVRWKYFNAEVMPQHAPERGPVPERKYHGSEVLPWIEETAEFALDTSNTDKLFYLDLYATLRDGSPLAVTPESVRRVLSVLDTCRHQNSNL